MTYVRFLQAIIVLPIVIVAFFLLLVAGALGGPIMQDALLDALKRRRS